MIYIHKVTKEVMIIEEDHPIKVVLDKSPSWEKQKDDKATKTESESEK